MIPRKLRAKVTRHVKKALRDRGIHVMRNLPRGADMIADIDRYLPDQTMRVVFDVGVHDGRSADAFLASFPQARVWCFEPNAEMHSVITERLAKYRPRVTLEAKALGASAGNAILQRAGDSSMSFIGRSKMELPGQLAVLSTAEIVVDTLDSYCGAAAIDRIDLLKVDTEGHDLDVLRGGEEMLSRRAIACLQCECSTSPDNRFHVQFEDVKNFLEPHGYRLFGIYEQMGEWTLSAPYLRRVNAAFVSLGSALPRIN